jgi:prephenate dehydrogenase
VTSSSSNDRVLAIVGVGLLGGSVALAAKANGLASRVIGIGRNEARLQAAQDAGILDDFTTDPAKCDSIWDLVVVGTPVDRIPQDVVRLAKVSRPGTVVTDVGSVKQPICSALENEMPSGVHFVGSHPLAGSEKSGFEASRANLFEDRVTVVTPTSTTSHEALATVETFWSGLGSRVICMSSEDHDEALAKTSHLPHVVASALAAVLKQDEQQFASSGFRDTTRLAAGDPAMWIPILMSNSVPIVRYLAEFSEQLQEFTRAIENQDAQSLKSLLEVAKTSRDALN